jgi:hypothetical protein
MPGNGLAIPSRWPAQVDLLSWCQNMGPGMAALLIILGLIYLLFGISIFKALVLANAGFVGLCIGAALGQRADASLPAGIIGAAIAIAITWPLMKYAVAIMGGTFGALLGACVWRTVGLDPSFTWAGALMGIIAGGLLCFILFRGCVMMYTSLQGAVMLIFGILGLLFKYQELAPKIGTYMAVKPFLLPMAVFIPTIIGIIYQQHMGAPAAAGKK